MSKRERGNGMASVSWNEYKIGSQFLTRLVRSIICIICLPSIHDVCLCLAVWGPWPAELSVLAMTTSPAVGEGGEDDPPFMPKESKTSDRKHASLIPTLPTTAARPPRVDFGRPALPCLVVACGTHTTSNAVRHDSRRTFVPSPRPSSQARVTHQPRGCRQAAP